MTIRANQRPREPFFSRDRQLAAQTVKDADRQRVAAVDSAAGWAAAEAAYEATLSSLASQIRKRYPTEEEQDRFLDTVRSAVEQEIDR